MAVAPQRVPEHPAGDGLQRLVAPRLGLPRPRSRASGRPETAAARAAIRSSSRAISREPWTLRPVELQRRHRDAGETRDPQAPLRDHRHQVDALEGDPLGVEHHRRRARRMRGGDHVELRVHRLPDPTVRSAIIAVMLLAVDVGNTQTHLGAFAGAELVEHWRFRTVSGATGDEIAERIAGLLGAERDRRAADVDAIAVSSVVPPLGTEYERDGASATSSADCLTDRARGEDRDGDPDRQPVRGRRRPARQRRRRLRPGRRRLRGRRLRDRDQLRLPSRPTASTSAARSRPGVEVSLTALTERGARIPRIDLAEPEAAIGKSTRAAIQSGVIFGFAGLIDGIARRIVRELGGDPTDDRDRRPRARDRAVLRDDRRGRRPADAHRAAADLGAECS